jgi:hypothetical protein
MWHAPTIKTVPKSLLKTKEANTQPVCIRHHKLAVLGTRTL